MKKDLTKFHSKKNGCKLIPKEFLRISKSNQITFCRGLYCKTHKKSCSKTGWEWHFYLGTPSLMT